MKKIRSKWLKQLTLIMLVIILATMAACGNEGASKGENGDAAGAQHTTNQNEQNAGDNVNTNEENQAGKSAGSDMTAYPITVRDVTGADVTIEAEPQAIVSLVPSETEILFAIGAGHRVVGVDEYSNYPKEANSITKVGDMHTNIEAVTALSPDLILASSTMNGQAIEKLRELGMTVYASDPQTYDETVAHIEQIAVLLNLQAGGKKIADEMKAAKEEIMSKLQGVEPRKTYLEFSPGYTVGSGTFLDDLVNIAGGINIAAEQPGWYEVDGEDVVAQNPEVIIFPDFGEEQSSILAGIMSRPGWEVIDAVKSDRLVMVANDPLVRVGPRLVEGLKDIAAAIHPELFQ